MSFSQQDDILIKERSPGSLEFGDVVIDDRDADENDHDNHNARHRDQQCSEQPTMPRLGRTRRKTLWETTRNKVAVVLNKQETCAEERRSSTTTTANAFASLEELLLVSSSSSSSISPPEATKSVQNPELEGSNQDPENEATLANMMKPTPQPNQPDNDENCFPNDIHCHQNVSCKQQIHTPPNDNDQIPKRKCFKNKQNQAFDCNPVLVKHNPKSIVGSRPQHWEIAAPCNSSSARQRRQTPFLQPSQTKRKAALAAELTRAKKQRRFHHHPRTARNGHSLSNKSTTNDEQSADTAKTNTSISFVPSFLEKPSRSPEPSSWLLFEDSNSTTKKTPTETAFLRTNENPWQSSHRWTSPKMSLTKPTSTNTTTRKATGVLAKRLKAIRDNIHGDLIRFQSGQYPFTACPTHCNDPRYRAQTVADVTIVGAPLYENCHRNSDPHQQHEVIVRGYVHHWDQKFRNGNNSNSHHDKDDGCSLWFPGRCYAWIAFTFDTAREQTIVSGVSLRIYNARPVRLSGTAKFSHRDDDWMILCTQLCEPYPSSILPAIEVPPSSQQRSATTILNQSENPETVP